jgi:hypothetical protein
MQENKNEAFGIEEIEAAPAALMQWNQAPQTLVQE